MLGKLKILLEDRFIFNWSVMNFEVNYYKMVLVDFENEENECVSFLKVEFKKNMVENFGGNELNVRIFVFKNKVLVLKEGILLLYL